MQRRKKMQKWPDIEWFDLAEWTNGAVRIQNFKQEPEEQEMHNDGWQQEHDDWEW